MDLTKREGSAVVVGGRIKAIAPNPIKSRLWVMRLYIENGFIEFLEKPSSRVATRWKIENAPWVRIASSVQSGLETN